MDDADARRARCVARARRLRARDPTHHSGDRSASDLYEASDRDGAHGRDARRAVRWPVHPRHRHQPQGDGRGHVGHDHREACRRNARIPDHRAEQPARWELQLRRPPLHGALVLLGAAPSGTADHDLGAKPANVGSRRRDGGRRRPLHEHPVLHSRPHHSGDRCGTRQGGRPAGPPGCDPWRCRCA